MYYGLILLSTIGFIYMICVGSVFYGITVMMPAMIHDLGWTRAQGAAGFAVLSMIVGLTGPVVTAIMKRVGPRLTIILGGFITATGACILYRYHSLPVYYLCTAILGWGMTMQAILPGVQLVTQWFQRRRSMALGVFMAAGGLGGVIGAPSFAWLIEMFGDWRPVWLVVGATALFASLLSWLLVRNQPEDMGQQLDRSGTAKTDQNMSKKPRFAGVYKTTRDWAVKEVFRDTTYWIILVSGGLAVTAHMIVSSQLVLHVNDMGMTAIIAATALGIQGFFTTGGRLISGVLGDFAMESRNLLLCGMALEFIGMLMLPSAHNPYILYTSVILFGLGFGLGLVGSTAMLANYYGPANTATLLSYRILLSTVFGAVGVVLAGYGGDVFGGYQEVFYTFSIFLFIGVLLVLWIRIPKADLPLDLSSAPEVSPVSGERKA